MTIKSQQIKAAFWAIDLVLAATFTFIMVNAGQHLFAQPDFTSEFSDNVTTAKKMGGQQKIASRDKYAGLRKSELFGPQSSSAAPPKIIEEAPPDTTLSLQLKGIVAQEGSGPDYATILNTKTNVIDNYGVGDFVMPEAEIVEIRDFEVIISRSGDLETLRMVFSGKTPAGIPGSRRGMPSFPPRRSSRDRSSNEAIRVVNDNLRQVNKSKLLEQVNQNLASLLNSFRTSPNMVEGEQSGLSIDQIGSDPISSRAGIKTGDVIKKINGQPVSSIDSILAQGERLKDSTEIRVEIERGGHRRTLRYMIR